MSKRAVTLEDLYRYELLANPVVSPDGKLVLYEETRLNQKTDEYETALVAALTDGSDSWTLTTSGTRNVGAVFSPDGQSVAFVSNRDGGVAQAYVLPLKGGEAKRVTRFKNGIGNLVWTPDGKTLIGSTSVKDGEEIEVYAEELSAKEVQEESQKAGKEWAENPKRYDTVKIKFDGAGLSRQRESQLVAVDVATGEFSQLTKGPHSVSGHDVSPDGKYVVFASNRREDSDLNPYHSDVYRVPVDGGDLELLHSDTIAYALSYSPDGKEIAFFGNRREFESATHTHLYTIPAAGGEAFQWTTDFSDTLGDSCIGDMRAEVRGGGPRWSTDGKFIYTQSTREGRCEIVRFERQADGTVQHAVVAGGDRDIFGFDFSSDTDFVLAYGTMMHPNKLVAVKVDPKAGVQRAFRPVTSSIELEKASFPQGEIRLDNASDTILEEVGSVQPVAFEYTSVDDWKAQGWVMKPFDFEEGKKYPVILDIHGGPQMMYGYTYFHEMQWFAAQGYAVVFVNPRGSMGYGQEFVNAVRHDFGGSDAADVLNGLDAAIAKFDFLDGTRVGVTGGSYGGFMTNWLVGHTDRFFAAVSQRSISNWFSFYGVSDIGPTFVTMQLGGDIFSNAEELWRMSPLKYAKDVKTPILLLHSENDLRCPIEQAEQFYTAVKMNGGETELLRIPNASHGLSRNGKPKLRIERLQAIFGYINDRLPE